VVLLSVCWIMHDCCLQQKMQPLQLHLQLSWPRQQMNGCPCRHGHRMQYAACQGHVAMVVCCAPQGRRWPDVEKRFADMWGMALRALDDVKESVRLDPGYLSVELQQTVHRDHLPCVQLTLAPHDTAGAYMLFTAKLIVVVSAVHLLGCAVQVRAAAVTLARALRGLTLRVTDRAQSSEADAAAAVAVALPLLLEKGW
jgi:hypothetical protein